jgi:biopolymer transport protein ExbD
VSEEALGHFRTAHLTVAVVLLVIFLALLSTLLPTQHIIRLDLPGNAEASLDRPSVQWHRVTLIGDRQVTVDGVRCGDHIDLRMALDILMVRDPLPSIEFEIAPEVRHEEFLMTLAVLKRASVEKIRLRNATLSDETSAFRDAGRARLADARDPKLELGTSELQVMRATSLTGPIITPGCAAQFG